MNEYPKKGPDKYPNIYKSPRIDRTNFQIYSKSQEFIEQMSKYIQILKNLLNEYPNIFGGSWNDWMNIQINWGGGKATNMIRNSIGRLFVLYLND